MASETRKDITALMMYLDKHAGPAITMMTGSGGESECSGIYRPIEVPVQDARHLALAPILTSHGFEFHTHRTAVNDFYVDDVVRQVYYPEMEVLLQRATGASKVIVFDHNTRSASAGVVNEDVRRPVRLVHNDFTADSGPERVRRELAEETANRLLENPFIIVNLWRPIRGPVESVPLAVCHARSIATQDLVVADLVYAHRTGHEYRGTFSPEHRWFYYPDMCTDEVLLIKVFDSQTGGENRFSLHTAFDDPTTSATAAPRESIEVRAFAFFC